MNGAQFENQQDSQPNAGAAGADPGFRYTQQMPPAGAPYAVPPRSGVRKSPFLATLLSMMPGLGQVYVGYYQQGFINILVVAATIAALNAGGMRGMEPFLGVFLAFYWIFNMIDANRRAEHYNRVAAGLGGEHVPDDFKLPSAGGSMFGGVVLVVIGILFIMDLNFDVSLEWVENWWPLVLVAFGGNLIYQARRKAK